LQSQLATASDDDHFSQMAEENQNRKHLTFEQAEGAEPLPEQLKLRELSPQLRAQL
jgi:hypothetical protein